MGTIAKALAHCTYWLEGCDFGVSTEGWHVVDCQTTILWKLAAVHTSICHLWDSLVRSVFRGFEVDIGSPVVTEILREGTRSTCRQLGGIKLAWVHLDPVSRGF